MSSSATSAASSQSRSRAPITDLPIAGVLVRIFNFAVEKPQEAVLQLGLVSKYWNDCTVNFSHEMWQRLHEKYYKKARARQFSYYSFKKRAQIIPLNHLVLEHVEHLHEIENCVPEFRFKCPLVIQQLQLTNEVTPSGMSVMHCDVCDRKVYPVTDANELKQNRAEGRCIYVSKEVGAMLKKNANKAASGCTLHNFAIVTTERAPSASSRDEGGIAEKLLILLYTYLYEYYGMQTRLLSRDTLLAFTSNMYDQSLAFFRIVRVAAPPKDFSKSTLKQYEKIHPASQGNPLAFDQMPSLGGWGYLVSCTEDANKWFEKDCVPAGDSATPVRAIAAAAGYKYKHLDENKWAEVRRLDKESPRPKEVTLAERAAKKLNDALADNLRNIFEDEEEMGEEVDPGFYDSKEDFPEEDSS